MSDHWDEVNRHNRPEVTRQLTYLGFRWAEPGYWSLVTPIGLEVALEPQVLNAGEYKLQIYLQRTSLLRGELLVDVKPRPTL